jgi:hypothetical protein
MLRNSALKLLLPCILGMMVCSVAWSQGNEALLEEAEAIKQEDEVDVSRIDQILRGDQEVRQGEFFGYDPAGRRDPFRSLLDGLDAPDEEDAAVRPPGLAGMMVEELVLQGIVETPDGILAFVLGRDNISYIIRPGTVLYNGEVKEIQPDRVIYRQQVNDPKQVRPFEEIVRTLSD